MTPLNAGKVNQTIWGIIKASIISRREVILKKDFLKAL